LWVQKDRNHKITNRTAVKEIYLGPYWNDPDFWVDVAKRLPKEAAVQKSMSRLNPKWCFVDFYTDVVYVKRQMFRVYMEYCPLGQYTRVYTIAP